MSQLCAHCVEYAEDCTPMLFDGRLVQVCKRCREAPVNEYNFAEAPQSSSPAWLTRLERRRK